MLSTQSLLLAAQVVTLGTLFPLFPAHPLSIWNVAFNTRTWSPAMQSWRSLGRYYVFVDRKHSRQMNIFYVDLQSGTHSESANDTLLLLHGFPSSSADFQVPMLRKLQTKFGRIIAYDYPGYGLSDKPRGLDPPPYTIHTYADVAEQLLAQLGVARLHMLAHDVGDTVAQELLERHNSRQANAALTGGASEGPEIQSVAFLNGGLLPELHRPVLTQRLLNNAYTGPLLGPFITYQRFSKSLASVFGPGAPAKEAFLQDTFAALTFNGGNLIMHELIKYIPQRVEHRDRWVGALQKTDVPLALINGPADPVSGRHAAEGLKKLVPDVRVTYLADNIGHYPQVESPKGVLKAYFAFLESDVLKEGISSKRSADRVHIT